MRSVRGAIHTITIERMGTTAPDAEGRHSATVLSTQTVQGRVMVKIGREEERVGRFGQDLTAVAVVPGTVEVGPKDRVTVSGTGSDQLDATYEVMWTNPIPGLLIEIYMRTRGWE